MQKEIFKRPKPFILIIIDGLGVAPPGPGNSVTSAATKTLDKLWPRYPHCYLHASGSAVGLPSGTNGNSEVGHMNIGAGKVVFQELPRIDNAIQNGTFYQNDVLIQAINHAKKNNSSLHLIGCVSEGNVHSSMEHIYALIETAKRSGIEGRHVLIHAFTDGRDTPPKSATTYLEEVEAECQRKKIARIASVCGRYYGMDRDQRWDRTKIAYDMLTKGVGKIVKNWREAINLAYNEGETDEYITPRIIIDNSGAPPGLIKPNDSVIFFNFRADRAIQLTKAFVNTEFLNWQRGPLITDLFFVGMSDYEKGLPKYQAFPQEDISMPIGRVISDAGLRQLRIAESEKFPHVTYFINGGNDIPYQGEDRIEIPSPRNVATYDQRPEMSAYDVCNTLIQQINKNIYDFIVVNFANPDMVSHTGVLQATVRAIQVVDECIDAIVKATLARSGALVITSDHGNAEEMVNLNTGKVDTEHSTNPVPFIYVDNNVQSRELSLGILADIAPTILSQLGIKKPTSMTGRNLLA